MKRRAWRTHEAILIAATISTKEVAMVLVAEVVGVVVVIVVVVLAASSSSRRSKDPQETLAPAEGHARSRASTSGHRWGMLYNQPYVRCSTLCEMLW